MTTSSPSTNNSPAAIPVPEATPSDTDASTFFSRLKEMPVIRNFNAAREVIGLLVIGFAAVAAPFRNAELEVRHVLHTISPPSSITAILDSVGRTFVADTLLFVRTANFASSREVWQIRLENTTSRRIGDLDLQLTGVVHVEDSGITTTSSAIQQRARAIRVVEGSEYNTARVEGLDHLPPKAIVELTIWGDFTQHPDPDPRSTAGSTRIRHFAAVSGLGRVIHEHRVELTYIAGFLILLLALRRSFKGAGGAR